MDVATRKVRVGSVAARAMVGGAVALGSLAVGALSIGALAIGRVLVGRAEIRDLRIGRGRGPGGHAIPGVSVGRPPRGASPVGSRSGRRPGLSAGTPTTRFSSAPMAIPAAAPPMTSSGAWPPR
jgi:hypothetical protein